MQFAIAEDLSAPPRVSRGLARMILINITETAEQFLCDRRPERAAPLPTISGKLLPSIELLPVIQAFELFGAPRSVAPVHFIHLLCKPEDSGKSLQPCFSSPPDVSALFRFLYLSVLLRLIQPTLVREGERASLSYR